MNCIVSMMICCKYIFLVCLKKIGFFFGLAHSHTCLKVAMERKQIILFHGYVNAQLKHYQY